MHAMLRLTSMSLLLCFMLVRSDLLLADNGISAAIDEGSQEMEAPGESRIQRSSSTTTIPGPSWKTPPFANSAQSVKPEKLDSPRSLMWSLGRTLNTYREILEKEGRTYESEPRLRWIQSRIAQCFDLSDIGPEFQNGIATDSAVYLREIIAHPHDDLETIPDLNDINKMAKNEQISRYRFDSVPIELMVLTEGERAENGSSRSRRATRLEPPSSM